MQDQSVSNDLEKVIIEPSRRVAITAQPLGSSSTLTSGIRSIEIEFTESTIRIETEGGDKTTAVIEATNDPESPGLVESTVTNVGGKDSMQALRIDAPFSHDIVMFLLWLKRFGIERSLRLAEHLKSPWPESLAACRVMLVASGRPVAFGWLKDSTDQASQSQQNQAACCATSAASSSGTLQT